MSARATHASHPWQTPFAACAEPVFFTPLQVISRSHGQPRSCRSAANGRASAIVTFNKEDFGTVPLLFGIEVLSPVDALRGIKP